MDCKQTNEKTFLQKKFEAYCCNSSRKKRLKLHKLLEGG